MKLLENELIQKYFGCVCLDKSQSGFCHSTLVIAEAFAAYGVLQAMSEPIKKGEKALCLHSDGSVAEIFAEQDSTWHMFDLRLPDAFQPKPDPVEEKIKEISKNYFVSAEFEKVLRDLVAVARKESV